MVEKSSAMTVTDQNMQRIDTKKIVDLARTEAAIAYATAYDFEPTWNRATTLAFSIFVIFWLILTIGALL